LRYTIIIIIISIYEGYSLKQYPHREARLCYNCCEIFTTETTSTLVHGCISADMHLRSAFAALVHSWMPLADARSASNSARMCM